MEIANSKKLSELTVADAKRILVYGCVLALAVGLFIAMLGRIAIAVLLGLVAAAWLLPIQRWFEKRLRAREGSALITIAVIVLPLTALVFYLGYELSIYSTLVHSKQSGIIGTLSRALAQYLPITPGSMRAALEAGFTEAMASSVEMVQALRQQVPLLLTSTSLFFFTIFYVLTQRTFLAMWVKSRVPGEYQPLYERLSVNVGGALRGALRAVFIDQSLKAAAILVLNLVFSIPLAVSLAFLTFLIGFFPLLGEWAVYVPVGIYLLAFRHEPKSAAIYLLIGLMMTISSSLLLRPRLASSGTRHFNFYWMLVALVTGVYSFGIPGIVLGPAILGFTKAVVETLFGASGYHDALLITKIQPDPAHQPELEANALIEEPKTVTVD